LELKTLNSPRLQGKLIIDIPNFIHATNYDVTNLLTTYSMEQSDVVLVFCDLFNTSSDLAKALTATLVQQQESNKLLYLFDDSTSDAATWQKKLADLGLTIGQFIGTSQLGNQTSADFILLEQRLANAGLQRSYRVLHALEKSIRDVENVVIQETKQAIFIWKERATFCTLIILGLLAMLAVILEVEMGFLELLLDPIIGSAILLTTTAFMIPLHVLISKMQAQSVIRALNNRQKSRHLVENIAALFEKNITFSRMMLPISDPVGWNKKSKAQLAALLDKAKNLVQSLNDNFNIYNAVAPQVVNKITPNFVPEVVQTAVAPQPATPQRQSALMQKILKK
jgi:hypothetical protein